MKIGIYWQISNISKTNHTYRSFKRKKKINQKVLKMSALSNFNTDGMKEKFQAVDTTKSFSEALNLESVNPQYDNRLFTELRVQIMFATLSCCVQKLF